jgi:Ca2+/Na+ antiporter
VWFGALTYIHGIIFLLIFFIFVIGNVFKANQTQRVESNQLVKAQPNKGTLFRTVGILLIGLVGLPFGATWVILGATGIATVLGISEEVIGLTLVAVGTSLPELSTSILSALRKEPELLMGSIIGSNIFNVLCIGGVTSIINPLNFFGATKLESLFVLVAVTLILAPFIFLSRSINKIWGVTFLVAYVVYLSKLL